MDKTLSNDSGADQRIVLGLLNSVEDGATSQRRIASDLGIALGLVNAYLKRCVKKGLVKVSEAPARRYAYYLTPHGFAEKSRLTVEYLSSSFSFFRKAKADYAQLFDVAKSRNLRNFVFLGKSDLAEIAVLSALESGISVVAIVDRNCEQSSFAGVRVVRAFDELRAKFDAVAITDVRNSNELFDEAEQLLGGQRVFAPALLALNMLKSRGGSNDPR
jgi:DNA-binding MarR family transcriptional regulator